VIWFYEREGATARVEELYDNDTKEHVLCFVDAAGRAHIERFDDQLVYRRRLQALEAELEAEEWHNRRAPMIIPQGLAPERKKE
jgi:hypothetical protein